MSQGHNSPKPFSGTGSWRSKKRADRRITGRHPVIQKQRERQCQEQSHMHQCNGQNPSIETPQHATGLARSGPVYIRGHKAGYGYEDQSRIEQKRMRQLIQAIMGYQAVIDKNRDQTDPTHGIDIDQSGALHRRLGNRGLRKGRRHQCRFRAFQHHPRPRTHGHSGATESARPETPGTPVPSNQTKRRKYSMVRASPSARAMAGCQSNSAWAREISGLR